MYCCAHSSNALASVMAGEQGATPLYIAAEQGQVGAMRLLLDKGAPVDAAKKDVCFVDGVGFVLLSSPLPMLSSR